MSERPMTSQTDPKPVFAQASVECFQGASEDEAQLILSNTTVKIAMREEPQEGDGTAKDNASGFNDANEPEQPPQGFDHPIFPQDRLSPATNQVKNMQPDELEYVGFWPRVGASLIDTIMIAVITWPILTMFYGGSYWISASLIHGSVDFLVSWVFPAIAVILFWMAKQATPGKMAVSAKIVDAKTGHAASTGQLIGRYFACYLSLIPLGLGFIWVFFDDRKQGWHDKLAGTVVVRKKNREPKPVKFE